VGGFCGTKGTNYKQKIKPDCHVSTSNLADRAECFIHGHQSHYELVDLINKSLSKVSLPDAALRHIA